MILLIVILILLAALMILSFIGPEKGGGRFWRIIQKVRSWLDAACYWLFNAFAVGTIILVCVILVRKYLM